MNEKEPIISIVITTYNYAQYLPLAIESAIGQTYNSIEVIVVNDGSTDDTSEVISPYLNNQKFKYIKQANAGQANAKNTGIKNANGQLIAFLDADDIWEKSKLEKQVKLFHNLKTGVVFSRARYINKRGEGLNYNLTMGYLTPRSGNVTKFLFYDNFIPFSSSVVRRECFEKYGLFDETLEMAIDWDLWLRISTGHQFDFIDEPLLLYRIGHSGQMSKNIEKRYHCIDRVMNAFIKKNPNLLPDSIIRDSKSYKYCGIGYYYRKSDPLKSLKYYFLSLKNNPLKRDAYIGLMKTILLNSLLKHKN